MRRNVWHLAAGQAMGFTGSTLLVATSALVGLRLAPREGLATLPMALQMVANMLTTIPASLLMQRIGRRGGFLVGSAIGIVGAALAVRAIVIESFALFAMSAALSGSANAFLNYYRFAAADAVDVEERPRAISWVLAGGVIAALVGPNLARWTRTWLEAPFAGSYVALTGIMVLSFLNLTFLDLPRPAADAHRGGRPLSAIVSQPVFLCALICGMTGYALMSLVMTATPLSMQAHHHAFNDTAFVIQWHALGMFAPSFVTGELIRRFGVLRVMLAGVGLIAACVVVNLTGTTVLQYATALGLLGVGWNFLFIGSTTLITEAHSPQEKGKAQALNDFAVFSTVTLAVLSAGALQHAFGWRAVNLGALPVTLIPLGAVLWLMWLRRGYTGHARTAARAETPGLGQ
ncbi:MAG: MFS transporter [Gemmatimonadaceae bacterium]